MVAYCPNTGSLRTAGEPGSEVLLSWSTSPRRKTAWTWELVLSNGVWVGINTLLPNRLLALAIEAHWLPEFRGWSLDRREARMGEHSRVDLLLRKGEKLCFLEIKNVTMVEEETAFFPDAVTSRGSRHLRELEERVKQGHRAVMFFLIQREDGLALRPADSIDPAYGRTLRRAVAAGVEAIAYRAKVSPEAVELVERVPVIL